MSDALVVAKQQPIISSSYIKARRLFLNSAAALNGVVTSHENEAVKGIQAEALFCDTVLIGDDAASKCIVVSSGTHGIEGYCGSALQVALMEYVLPSWDLSEFQILFVHAINPYGFSHLTRVNEDNVDINRNFADSFGVKKEEMTDYLKFRRKVFPENWRGSELSKIYNDADQFVARHGAELFQTLMTKGQYILPEDPYFGGTEPTWSHRIWRAICETSLRKFETVVHIDLHSGLGPFGECEIIYTGPNDTQALGTAKSWYGSDRVITPGHADSVSPSIDGPLPNGLLKTHPKALCVAFEFGTVPIMDMLKALIASNWLFHNPQCNEQIRLRVLEQSRQAFCPDDPVWIDCVWETTKTLFFKTIDGIRSCS